MSKLFPYRLLLILAAAVLIFDQATKVWVVQTLPYGSFFPPSSIEVIPGLFNIVHVGNTGAAWSMFSDYTWALAAVGFVALALIFVFRKALELKLRMNQIAFGLIIGGIVGNLIDRIRIGHVVDFLDFHLLDVSLFGKDFGDLYFPSFNVADSGITVGVAIYIYFSFKQERSKQAAEIQEKKDQP
ncbi:signal peptidase II [Pelagicoccus sp. SDUM812003]|uniref:signal peptidase II n=1 Tax=Pelagicoccus sp. SDUM812003 TaxID=3041267 RepID=UPI00280C522D|nr:signal peptidase II [Pelagicoccus sp. SDUM812003]MDQ8202853.1 signal peptidase II [Pelagicoccus sp. SDUM812003]